MTASPTPSQQQTIQRLDAALPQTQCTRCGYPDCAAYAQAIVLEGAAINRCPPGGQAGVERLAQLTGQPARALDPSCGQEAPLQKVRIDEDWCIGCTLCLAACPTDAIVGGNKFLHTVIADQCTGCGLCVPACPVDCIQWEPVPDDGPTGWDAWTPEQASEARARYEIHKVRWQGKVRTALAAEPVHGAPRTAPVPDAPPSVAAEDKKARLAAILAKARERKPV